MPFIVIEANQVMNNTHTHGHLLSAHEPIKESLVAMAVLQYVVVNSTAWFAMISVARDV